MTDNKKERTIRDILSDEVERQLEKNPPAKPSFEEFREMAYRRMKNDKEGDDASEEGDNIMPVETKNIKRILRTAGVAAGFVMAVLAGMFAMNSLNSEVGADKNPKEEIVTEDGVIIEDGGYGSSDGEDGVYVVTDWEHVKMAKEMYPELMIPEYVPEGYIFKKLNIEKIVKSDMAYEYLFGSAKGDSIEIEITVIEGGEVSNSINNVTRLIEAPAGNIYVQEKEHKATMYMDGGLTISIWGEISDDDIINIIDSLSF